MKYYAGKGDSCVNGEEMLARYLKLTILRIAIIDLG